MTLGPLMVDVAGHELTAEDRRVLVHPLVAEKLLPQRLPMAFAGVQPTGQQQHRQGVGGRTMGGTRTRKDRHGKHARICGRS